MGSSEVKGEATEKGLRMEALRVNGPLFCCSLLFLLALAPSALGTSVAFLHESLMYIIITNYLSLYSSELDGLIFTTGCRGGKAGASHFSPLPSLCYHP